MSVFRSAEGRVRSGWVIATFAAIAGALGFLWVIGIDFLGVGGADSLEPRLVFSTSASLVSGLIATGACWLLFTEPTALDTRPARPLLLGFGLGALAIALSVVPPVLVGAQTLSLNHEWSAARAALEFLALAPAGVGEELLLRGLALQALRRGVGDVPAIAASSALFGVLHLTNPHASWVAALIITLVGLWFGAMLVRTGTLWAPMGLHLGWNFFEGSVLGQPVSGLSPGTPLFVAHWPAERGFWSGAHFGPEAAGWTVVVLLIATALTLVLGRGAGPKPPSSSLT